MVPELVEGEKRTYLKVETLFAPAAQKGFQLLYVFFFPSTSSGTKK